MLRVSTKCVNPLAGVSCEYCGECGRKFTNHGVDDSEVGKLNNVDNKIIFPQTIGNITFYSKGDLFEWVIDQQELNIFNK